MATDCNPEFPQVKGYRITQELYTTDRAIVYQGVSEEQQGTVAVKLPRSASPEPDEISRFRHEYLLSRHLTNSGIVRTLALEPWGNGYALIMEDHGGVLLKDYTPKESCSWLEVLAIALQLADILHNLHLQQVLHKDIKPTNILIHPKTHQVWLTGFGLASRLPRENQDVQAPSQLEGTLAYIAPEQTGRMNRSIDYRTDFYALGITLYELLTGQLPFLCDDPMELVYCHLAKMPHPVHVVNESVPIQVSAIIQKLMAKNAEERYQSSLGLKHDLNTCLQQWHETEAIEPFELGQRDYSPHFLIPEKLYGRDAAVQTLLDAFERVRQGGSELILVTGYSGVGKTTVVNEIYKPITQHQGYFIQGKFDQLNRSIPFSAFAQAFQGLVGQLLGESDTAVAAWQTKILEAVGTNGRVILEFIPALERIIGEQPPITPLSGAAAQNRFKFLFSKFVQVFTSAEHPLVIFLDDLQWVDAASLNLLKVLADNSTTGSTGRNLLIMGAYRDNEVLPEHPLFLAFKELDQREASVHRLTLNALTQSEITHWVADSLLCTSAIAAPLSKLVYQKAQGNPFFTAQFLTNLYSDNHITFDYELGHWKCDLTQVKQLALTHHVVDYLVERLQKLPEMTQAMLQLAACVGNRFDLSTLAIICDRDRSSLSSCLWQALKDGLIVPEREACKFFQSQEDHEQLEHEQLKHDQLAIDLTISYQFLHDRVQQAAYALIPDSKKPETHYKIGQLLLQHIPSDEQANHIFEIVGQLNEGISILSSQADQDNLAQLNLTAHEQAKNATAYWASYKYAQTGLSLLGDASAWNRQYNLTLALHNALSTSALLCGEFGVMETTVTTIIEHAESILEQIPAYLVLIQSKVFRNQRLQAIEMGLKVLKKLGLAIPFSPTQLDIEQQLKQVAQLLEEHSIPSLVNLPVMTDKTAVATVQVAIAIIPSAYSVVPPLCPILIALIVEQSIQYGNTGISAFAYSSYGFIACNIFNDIKAGQQFGQLAQEIIAQFDARSFEASVAMTIGIFITHRYTHIRDTFPLLRSGYTSGLDVGDLESAGINAQLLCQHLLYSGEALEAWLSEAQNYYQALTHFHQSVTARYCKLTISVVLSLQGHSSSPVLVAEDAHRESGTLAIFQSEPDPMGLSYFYIYKSWLGYLFGQLELAQSCAHHARENLPSIAGLLPEGLFWFLDSLVALASTEEAGGLTSTLERVEANQQRLIQHWAHHAPMNYQHKVDLVNAEKYRILGHKSEAIDHYDRAIAGAQENRFLQEEALAHELAAKFYLDWGKEKIAAMYLQDAYRCYAEWGAKAKTNELEQRYPQLLQPQPQGSVPLFTPYEILAQVVSSQTFQHAAGQPSAGISQPSGDAVNQAFDFAAVLKAAQALTETLEFDELLRKLSRIILQNAGGDRLILALPHPSTPWQVRLTATAETIDLCTQPLDGNSDTPFQLIQYVKRTKEWVTANHHQTDVPVTDQYLLQHQPQSFLCAPLITQDELCGILYLHSSTARGLITPDRVIILNFLFSQVAIGLKNARAFQDALSLKSKVIESSLDGMAIVEEGKFIYVNQAHISLFGYESNELLGESWNILYASSEAQRLIKTAFPEVAQNGKWSGEATAQRKNGSTFAQEVSLVQLDDGKLICVCRDISTRKATELALQTSQARIQRITENVPGMLYRYVLHPDGSHGLSYVSSQVRELYELEPKIALQDISHLQERIHPDDRAYTEAVSQESAETLQPFKLEHRLILPKKGLRWIQAIARPERMENGDIVWDGLALDITERKATELALQESQNRFRRTTENIPGMIFRCVMDPDGTDTVTHISSKVREIYELDPEAVLEDGGRQMWERVHPDDLARVAADIQISAETLQPFKNEQRLILPKKGLRWIQTIAQPEHLDNGYMAWDGVVIDITERKAAELALKESQARFQRMTDNVPGMIHRYILHADGSDEMTYVDSQVREIFEAEPEAVIHDVDTLWDRFHPDDVHQMRAGLQVSAETLQPFIIESRLLLPQKGLRWIQIFAAPERLENGDCFWDGVAIDISDRKAIELALQESQARFQRMTENVPGMIYRYVLHPDGREEYTYVSSQVRDFCELEPETVLSDISQLKQRVHPDDLPHLWKETQISAETLSTYQAEFRLIFPQKGLRWVRTISIPERLDNGDVAWDGLMVDITDQKQAEQQLRELSERLELAIDSAQLGIWEWDYQNECLCWDDRMFAIFGVAPKDFQGAFQDWERCVHPDDLAYAKAGAFPEQQPPDGNNLSTKEYRIIHPDGSIRYVLATAVIQWDQQGQLARAIGMNLDITDKKIAEDKLQKINRELEQTNQKLLRATKMKGEFLANMSHELRTPLNSVIGFSQLLQRDRSLSQQHQETLNTINRSGEYLLELINDILEMSKIEAGQITLDFAPVHLHQLLNELKDSLQIKANHQHLQFNFSYDPQLPQCIKADKVKLRQILLNLLGNALKFTNQGTVTFYAQALTQPANPDVPLEGQVCLQFSVTDTGPGISAEHQETIFQPFVQSSAGKRSHQSIGLGLPISRQLARMMGGDIAVTSVLGQGSTFDCEILATTLAQQTENTVEFSAKRYGNIRGLKDTQDLYRLLVADDNPENRTLLAQILSMPGFTVQTVCNGLEAVAMNKSWKPDLLWMDIRMPGMDGLEAVRQIRQSSHQPKIVAITANAFSDERDAALAAGCDGFISKPFSITQVLEQLEQYLNIEFDRETQTSHRPASSTSRATSEKHLIQNGFKTMPTDWQRALLSSMQTLNSESVRTLLTQIPEEQQPMADAMLTLAKDFRYDILLELLDPVKPEHPELD